MKSRALAAMRKALMALRCVIFTIYRAVYGFVWVIWCIGGLQLLEEFSVTAIPSLGSIFIVASVMVMIVGFIGFERDLKAFLLNPLPFLRSFLRLHPEKD